MKNAEYWERRFEILEGHLLNKAEQFNAKEIENAFRQAFSEVEKIIEQFYARFAVNNQISLSDARKWLTAGQLEEFHWTVEQYIEKAEESALNGKWIKELENASLRHRISMMDSLKISMEQELQMLGKKLETDFTKHLSASYEEGYYRSIYEIQKGVGVGTSFNAVDPRRIEIVLSKPWAADGYIFSQRIWKNTAKLNYEVQRLLTQQFIRNDYPENTIRKLRDQFGVSKASAKRLVHTESSFISAKSRLDSYKEIGVETYMISAAWERRTCDFCADMDRKTFPLSAYEIGVTANPFHPNCRCSTVPVIGDLDYMRLAKSDDGEYFEVPASMSYGAWRKAHVKEGDSK